MRPRSQYRTAAEAHVELERRGSGADTRALNFGSGRGARRTDCSVTCAWRLDGQTLFIGSLALYFTENLGSDVGPEFQIAFPRNDRVPSSGASWPHRARPGPTGGPPRGLPALRMLPGVPRGGGRRGPGRASSRASCCAPKFRWRARSGPLHRRRRPHAGRPQAHLPEAILLSRFPLRRPCFPKIFPLRGAVAIAGRHPAARLTGAQRR